MARAINKVKVTVTINGALEYEYELGGVVEH